MMELRSEKCLKHGKFNLNMRVKAVDQRASRMGLYANANFLQAMIGASMSTSSKIYYTVV